MSPRWFLLLSLCCLWVAAPVRADGPPDAVNLDQGWRLWLDVNAPWKDDKLYLPEEANLKTLPLNQPTGGWNSLDDKAGVPVNLPATAEQFYWGKAPNKVADPKHAQDVVNFDGTYQGVSWWYRMFQPPEPAPGQRLVLTFPGARQRAEVYVNGQLVGYHLVAETPFSADITKAVLPGATNQLAMRVTNPGGVLDARDDTLVPWGQYGIPASHGFGGLDGGVTLAVRGPINVSDVAVSNHTDARSVTLAAEVASTGAAYAGPVVFSILRGDKEVWTGRANVEVPAGGTDTALTEATVRDAELWDLGKPALYTARARLEPDDHTARDATFGFRWFTADGVGKNARFVFNRRRVFLRGARSHGFWAPNGLFPDRAAAGREADAMRALGLNVLCDAQHCSKPAALDAFDAAGLLRTCEAGGGAFAFQADPAAEALGKLAVPRAKPKPGTVDTSGEGGEVSSWAGRYALAKMLALVRANRSRPSVVQWTLAHALEGEDGRSPRVFNVLRRVHELDPSRLLVLKSGSGPKGQAWMLPYATEVQFDKPNAGSGWRDEPTPDRCPGVPEIPGRAVAGWQDAMYRSPEDFAYRTTDEKNILLWGGAAAGASPDNHTEITKAYDAAKATAYDRAAHDTLADVYEKAIDRLDFRRVFPTADALFRQAAARHYLTAARLLENARLSNSNDGFVLADWESTTVSGHGGLVDAWRRPKGDPAALRAATAPAALVLRARHGVVAKGESATVDAHLLNETNLKGACTLVLAMSYEGDKQPFFEMKLAVTAAGGERFGQLLKDDISFELPKTGLVRATASLVPEGETAPALTRTETLLCVVDPAPEPLKKSVAFVGGGAALPEALERQLGVKATPLADTTGKTDVVIVDTNQWQPERAEAAEMASDPELYRQQASHLEGDILTVKGLAPGAATVELFFAEGRWDRPGQRVFDVALNGKTVLSKFDLVRQSGKRGVAVVKTFTVDDAGGAVRVSVPHVDADRAVFAAVRVTDAAGQAQPFVFRPADYRDETGMLWRAADLAGFDWKPVLPGLLERVRGGARLVVLSSGGADAAQSAAALAEAKAVTFNGAVGASGVSSQGFWCFGKKHWLLEGLPSNGLLDWPYQVTSGDGLLLAAPGLESVVGFGRDHTAAVGVAAAVWPLGKGQVVFLALQNLEESFVNNLDLGFGPVASRRIMYNALR